MVAILNRLQPAGAAERTAPGWFDRHLSPILLSVAKKACTHPIHTVVTIAFLASYSYLGVLDDGVLERADKVAAGRVDFESLLVGSQKLRVGEETSWKWEVEEARAGSGEEKVHTPTPTRVQARR